MRRESALFKKKDNHQTLIWVVGMGYVGVSLAVAFAQADFSVNFRRQR